MKESDLGALVVEWLTRDGWEVWQEVQVSAGCPRADIVAKRGPALAVVECKMSLSFDVLDQASAWASAANVCYAAVPLSKRPHVVGRVLRHLGIGLLTVARHGYRESTADDVRLSEQAEFRRKTPSRGRLLAALREEHKTWLAAGSKAGGHYTPFTATCAEVLARVKASPGIQTKALMDGIAHHYRSDATARSALTKWAQQGSIRGVMVKREGKKLTWWPQGA